MSEKSDIKKPGTIIYNDWVQKCRRMSDEQFGRTMRIVLQYAQDHKEPDIDDVVIGTVFDLLKPSIDGDIKKYHRRAIANRENGKKGGRPPKTDENENPLEPSETQENREEPNDIPQKPDNRYRITGNGERKEDRDIPPSGGEPCGSHQSIFDHYLKLGLIKHKALTREMVNAIDIARRRGGWSWDELKTMLDRHAEVVKITAGNGEYAVRPRGITEFFGQKVKDGTALICSEYADDGTKWQLYKDGNPHKPRSDTPKHPKKAYFEREFTEKDSKRLEERFEREFWEGVEKHSAAAGGNTS